MSGAYSQIPCDGQDPANSRGGLALPQMARHIWKFHNSAASQPSIQEQAEHQCDMASSSNLYPNFTCFQTMQRVARGTPDVGYSNTLYIANTDHFGPECIGPGSLRGRMGDLGGFKRNDWEKMGMIRM